MKRTVTLIQIINVAPRGAQASVLLCRSQAQTNTEGCVRKGIRRKTFAKSNMQIEPDNWFAVATPEGKSRKEKKTTLIQMIEFSGF